MQQLPARVGVSAEAWARMTAPLDRQRDATLKKTADPTDLGGEAMLWYRTAGGVASSRLLIQPGVADDLPSLLSTLAAQLAWPGVTDLPDTPLGLHPDRAIAVWARVWQVREQADLRLTLHWDDTESLHADAILRPLSGTPQSLLAEDALITQIQKLATHPRTSESPHGWLLAGNRAMAAGDFEGARACYTRALADLPRHPEAHRNLALALARLDRWEEAATAMRQAWTLAPEDAAIRQEYLAVETDAGVAAAKSGALERAATHFLQVLSIWPEEPTALVNLGNIRLREGRVPEAKAAFRRLLRLHPNHATAKEVRLALDALGEY